MARNDGGHSIYGIESSPEEWGGGSGSVRCPHCRAYWASCNVLASPISATIDYSDYDSNPGSGLIGAREGLNICPNCGGNFPLTASGVNESAFARSFGGVDLRGGGGSHGRNPTRWLDAQREAHARSGSDQPQRDRERMAATARWERETRKGYRYGCMAGEQRPGSWLPPEGRNEGGCLGTIAVTLLLVVLMVGLMVVL